MAQLTATSLLRVSDVAKKLGVTSAAVRKWINYGLGGRRLKATRASSTGMFFVEEADLEDFLTSNQEPNDT